MKKIENLKKAIITNSINLILISKKDKKKFINKILKTNDIDILSKILITIDYFQYRETKILERIIKHNKNLKKLLSELQFSKINLHKISIKNKELEEQKQKDNELIKLENKLLNSYTNF